LISSGSCTDGGGRRDTQAKHRAIVNVSAIQGAQSNEDNSGQRENPPVNFFLNCARLALGIFSRAISSLMAKLFDLPRYIAVEGPIRVGKSTLSKILAERLNAQRVTDPEHNSFLGPFYQGEPGAAFQAQFTFLVQRFEQLRDLDLGARSQKLVVSDFIFETSFLPIST